MTGARAQRGVALISALLVVALASVAAVSVVERQQLNIRRTSNLIDGDQAWLYAQAAEDWTKIILAEDLEETQTDNLQEVWAQTLPPIDLPGGFMTGTITDLQAQLNLNNLLEGDGVDPVTLARLQRLLRLLELDPSLAAGVVDWLDADVEALPPDGAEDGFYAGLEHTYRTGNRPMTSASELRLVKGFTQEAYDKIAPYVTALPERTAINLNTAPPPVLASLADGLTVQAMARVIEARTEKPLESVTELTSNPQIQGLELQTQDLDVASRYFAVRIETRIGQGRAAMTSVIQRAGADELRVLRRAQGIN